jgi:transposase
VSSRSSLCRIDRASWTPTPTSWQEAGKSRKQKRTIKQLHADLVVLGYEGSYNRVAAFARDWRAARQREQKTAGRGVFVPLAFMAGEAFQFDWSEDWAVIAGERTKLQVAHFKLSYSRAFILRAYPQQTHEMLFDAHNHAFRVLGGVPRRGIYDNMRTAVDKIGRGKNRQVNARFRTAAAAASTAVRTAPEACRSPSRQILDDDKLRAAAGTREVGARLIFGDKSVAINVKR